MGTIGKVHFQACLRALGIGKVWDGNLDGFAEIERPRLLFDDAFGGINIKMQRRLTFNVNAGEVWLVEYRCLALHRIWPLQLW